MNTYAERYNLKPAAAWLRGHAIKTGLSEPEPADGNVVELRIGDNQIMVTGISVKTGKTFLQTW